MNAELEEILCGALEYYSKTARKLLTYLDFGHHLAPIYKKIFLSNKKGLNCEFVILEV